MLTPWQQADSKPSSAHIFWRDKSSDFATYYTASKEDLSWEEALSKERDDKLFFLKRFTTLKKKQDPWDRLSQSSHLFLKPQSEVKVDYKQDLKKAHYPLHFIATTPCKNQWNNMIFTAQDLMQKRTLEKIVFSVQSHYRAEKDIDPMLLACRLSVHHKNASIFAVQLTDKVCLLGATPETLFTKQQQDIFCDILAGTVPLSSKDPCGNALFSDPRYLHEVQVVEAFIKERLGKLCYDTATDPCFTVRSTSTLHHLYKKAKGTLADKVSNETLFSVFHPTPAVAGMPHTKSIEMIHHLEPQDRGFYSGAIGWLAKDLFQAEVCLRCCLIVERDVYFFAGAGIVQGSSPDSEWQEVESKIDSIKRFFYG